MNVMKWFHRNIRKHIKDDEFFNPINDSELHVWSSFVNTLKIFLENHWVENYKEFVEKL